MKKSIQLMVVVIGLSMTMVAHCFKKYYLANKSSLELTLKPLGSKGGVTYKLPAGKVGALKFMKEVSIPQFQEGYRISRKITKVDRYIELDKKHADNSLIKFGVINKEASGKETQYGLNFVHVPNPASESHYVVIDVSAASGSGANTAEKSIKVEVYDSFPAVQKKYPKATIDTSSQYSR